MVSVPLKPEAAIARSTARVVPNDPSTLDTLSWKPLKKPLPP